MQRQPSRSPRGVSTALILALLLALAGCASERVEGPDLLPLSSASVAVNETLRLPLPVNNPSGAALEFEVDGPDLPGLAEVSNVSGSAAGGEFFWTPLASHVGTHELTFTVRSALGDDAESVVIAVTPGASAAPVFLRPGAGGTYDLSREPCVRFDIEVRDDDSADVSIRLRGTLIEGARVDRVGPKQARLEWCPSPDQTGLSDRWTIELEADDGDHTPTPHQYLVVLRSNARDNCEGTAPSVTVQSPGVGERVVSSSGYRVVIQVVDDTGVRDAPLLYYGTVKPEDPENPDVTELDLATFSQAGGSWEATVPPIGLAPAEERTVYYTVSVTDNDDPTGTTCDHRTDTALSDFVAVGAESTQRAEACELCSGSVGCTSGLCAASGGGTGVCLPACEPGDACGSGTCRDTLTVEGATVSACGDREAYCEGGVEECVDDNLEDNDSLAAARLVTGSSVSATYCDGDPDFFAIVAGQEGEISLTLDGFDHEAADLDLELLDASGSRLDASGGLTSTELVSACVENGNEVVARVYSVIPGGQSSYTLSLQETAGDCCINDSFEPDAIDDPVSIPGHGNFEGVICPGDADHHSFFVDGPTHLSALIVFDHVDADLDLVLFGPDGREVTGAYSETNDEEFEIDLADPGDYVLRVEVYGDGSAEYLGQIELESIAGCAGTDDCPLGTVCYDGTCDSDACSFDDQCPSGHICPEAGPDGAQRHCAVDCTVNADCRDEGSLDEACKRFSEGRGCGQRGSGQNGDPCDDFSDCGGQRACLAWSGGYCARACDTDDDCEDGTFCVEESGYAACVRRCGGSSDPCRTAEGYECAAFVDDDGGVDAACVPEL